MSGAVNVLTPNGRRQNVKYSANMTILQIIEKVCEKQGFVSAEYDLRHQRKILDPKLSVRFSNIPNNAKLELVKAITARTETSTQIALQLPDGQRLQHSFMPSATLWHIIQHWQLNLNRKLLEDSEDGRPMEHTLVYMTHKITGESKLKETKLRSLGLTGGSAVIRLSGRAVELPDLPDLEPETSIKNDDNEAMMSLSPQDMDVNDSQEKLSQSLQSTTERNLEKETELKTSESPKYMETEMTSESTDPKQEGRIDAKSSNTETITSEWNTIRPEGVNVGSDAAKTSPGSDVRSDAAKTSPGSDVRSDAAKTSSGSDVRRKTSKNNETSVKEPLQNAQLRLNEFANFKFPEPVTDVDSDLQMSTDDYQVLSQTCDREALVFNLSDSLSETDEETPDEFFEVTVDDVRKMLADLKHKSTSESPLETTNMRENKEKKKMLHYKKAVIRIVFPDKMVLQGFFRSQETVQDLFEFVQKSIDEEKLEFYLYTSPPKTILKNTKETLFSAGLFPAAKVYFGCKCKRDSWLSPSLLSSVKPVAEVNESLKSVSGFVDASNTAGTSRGQQTSSSAAAAASKRPSSSTTHDSTNTSQKIPKWFKIGKN